VFPLEGRTVIVGCDRSLCNGELAEDHVEPIPEDQYIQVPHEGILPRHCTFHGYPTGGVTITVHGTHQICSVNGG
jgi:hypothetical protein